MFLAYPVRLSIGLAALLATNVLGALIPWWIKQAIDRLNGPPEALAPVLLTILAAALAMLAVRVVSRIYLLGLGRQAEYDLRQRLYGHLLKLPRRFFNQHPTGELMSRLTNDVGAIRFLAGGGIMIGTNTVLAFVTTLPAMVLLSPWLTLSAFVLYPFVIWALSQLSRRNKQAALQVQERLADISAVAQENLSGMPVIQAYVKEDVENQRFRGLCDAYYNAYQQLIFSRVGMLALMILVTGLSYWLVLLVGGTQVMTGGMALGGFIAFTLYLDRLVWPTTGIGWVMSILQQGVAALERVDEVLTAPLDPVDHGGLAVAPLRQEIRLQNLTFAYEAGGPPVLKDLSLQFPVGALVAIVGPVGAGKSTLLSLLPRLMNPPPGTIYWDNQDVLTADVGSLREHVTLMTQHSFLFSDSVLENMAYGQPGAGLATIQPFSETACFHEDALKLPNAYDTMVGERGITLSGGQRQRVALVRTLLLSPSVLLLDDPFASVDADTEARILAGLFDRKAFAHKLTLVATHRFSLVARADWVILLDAGRVVATGTHEKLLATDPLYQRLNRQQEVQA